MSKYMNFSPASFESDRSNRRFIPVLETNPPAANDVSVLALLTQAVRRWRIIVAVVAPALVLAVLYLLAVAPSFTAQALVEVTGSSGNAMNDAPAGPNYQETEAVQTQVEAIQAASVINEMARAVSPGDRAALLSPSWPIVATFEATFGPLLPQSADRDDEAQRLRETLAKGLSVEQVGLSAIISISFTAHDPALAARLANEVVGIAAEQARKRSADVMAQGISPITSQVGPLREQLNRELEAARSFRERNQLFGVQSQVALQAQLAVLNRRLADARSQQLAARSKVGALDAVVSGAGGADASSAVLGSPTISRLREEASQIGVELQSLTASLGERHPSVRRARSRMAEIDKRLEGEAARIVTSLRQDSAASRSEEELLTRSITDLQDRIAFAAKAEDQAADLDRQAAATQTVYGQMLQRETLLQRMRSTDLFVTSVRPISAAEVPWKKSHPKSALILVLVATVALIVALLLVLAKEYGSQARRRTAQDRMARS